MFVCTHGEQVDSTTRVDSRASAGAGERVGAQGAALPGVIRTFIFYVHLTHAHCFFWRRPRLIPSARCQTPMRCKKHDSAFPMWLRIVSSNASHFQPLPSPVILRVFFSPTPPRLPLPGPKNAAGFSRGKLLERYVAL